MASGHIFGDAGFKYTPVATVVTVLLRETLRMTAATVAQNRWVSVTLDNKNREVLSIAGGDVPEVTVTVRFDDDPGELMLMLTHAANGVTLNYHPSLAGGPSYPCILADSEFTVEPDPDRHVSHGEWQATFTLRRVDGGDFDPILT